VTQPKSRSRYYEGPSSDHFDGGIFFNPEGKAPLSLWDVLRWKIKGDKASRWPASWPSPFPQAKPAASVSGDKLRITMVGHSSTLVQVSGLNILTDPVWSERVSPFSFAGPRRVNAPGIAFEDLPKIDLVLLSHNHYDHLDLATLKRLKEAHDPLVITPLGNDRIVTRKIPPMRISAHDWGEKIQFSDDVSVHVEPAHHWSARGARDRRMALWCSFAIETPAGKIYFAGDTGFHGGQNYRALAEKHGGFRLSILPIGAYEPRWFMEAQHQNPDEAVQGMLMSSTEFAAGCHWGTFQLTDEPIDEPAKLLSEALLARNVAPERFRAMLPGEVWDIPRS
jgi:L-ascorbate metabolism protein UlaG (beta-lactamase superfamily)